MAKEENRLYNGCFKRNVEALEKALPPSVSAENIYVTLGSPWIPTSVIEGFIGFLLKDKWRRYAVKHDEVTGTWEFDFNFSYWSLPYEFRQNYGTSRRNGMEILLRTLNQQSVVVTDSIRSPHTKSGKQSVINKNETVLAMEKQKFLIGKTRDFARYLKAISERADDVRNGRVIRTEDNMLKITTDGRKAALDSSFD